eukprot:TRINITY_DN32038_c0_g1_i2.p1 TRINITY_DN32038_c0_g1~~TRINITY_DN32038_c0_g1_i2.p1  ORF type:complete len:498 (+),score=108.19 TRINITY_DN32038_c0_g1_i2:77-1570(+)
MWRKLTRCSSRQLACRGFSYVDAAGLLSRHQGRDARLCRSQREDWTRFLLYRACSSASKASVEAPEQEDGAKAADAPQVDATARQLLVAVRSARRMLREANALLPKGAEAKQMEAEELIALMMQLKKILHDTKAPPTYVRIVEITMEPCWDWAQDTPRLRQSKLMIQVLEAVERRLLQLHNSERHADTRFESLRMDLGTSFARTGGSTKETGDGANGASVAAQKWHSKDQKDSKVDNRQFLSHDGVGGRTQLERARNAANRRLENAVVGASEYRLMRDGHNTNPAEDLEDLERQVEDKIQIAMAKGEFDNLEGQGRPLRRLEATANNPFLDRGDQVGFDLMQQHGVAPEWIEQQKEIRAGHLRAKQNAAMAWLACNEEPDHTWLARKEDFRAAINMVNKKIRDYNLVCPPQKQMLQYEMVDELRHVRRDARGILGKQETAAAPKRPQAQLPPKRLMTPLREVWKSSKSASLSSSSGRSVWSRMADAFSFRSKETQQA